MVDEDSELEQAPTKKRGQARKRLPAKPVPRARVASEEPAEELEEQPTRRKFSTGFATLRDLISFIAGLAIIYHEVFQTSKVDAASVGVGVALLGLPVVFGADERRGKA